MLEFYDLQVTSRQQGVTRTTEHFEDTQIPVVADHMVRIGGGTNARAEGRIRTQGAACRDRMCCHTVLLPDRMSGSA